MFKLVRVAAVILCTLSLPTLADEGATRHFLFIGEPSPAAWKYLMDNPGDRQKEVAAGMRAIGGKIHSYYFGLGDGRNYIIAELPDDNEVIQAVYLMRLPTGLLNSYEMIELMPSAQMARALRKSVEFVELENKAAGGDN